MKKMMILAVMMVMTISANAMNYNAAKHEALFLSDKMAYELNLTAAQYEAVYEINLDYLMSINGHADVFGIWWDRRNADLRFVLNAWQYDKYITLAYFYRPVAWRANGWIFNVYTHYDRGLFYHAHPTVFVTYKGGNNHKAAHFYADRHVPKPAVHHNTPVVHVNKPAVHSNKPMGGNPKPNVRNDNRNWRSNGHASIGNDKGHGAPNRQIAQHTSRGGGHGGRR
jgi:hypothetical protein